MSKPKKKDASYFPIQTRMLDSQSSERFVNEIEGGLSIRDEVALRIFCAMTSNAGAIGKVTAQQMLSASFLQAENFIELSEARR